MTKCAEVRRSDIIIPVREVSKTYKYFRKGVKKYGKFKSSRNWKVNFKVLKIEPSTKRGKVAVTIEFKKGC